MRCAETSVFTTTARRRTTETRRIATGTYCVYLLRSGARVRDNHSWRNGGLLRRDIAGDDRALLVQTDAGDAKARARAFRGALQGTNSKAGGWAWLEHPRASQQYARPRTLWLTRTP